MIVMNMIGSEPIAKLVIFSPYSTDGLQLNQPAAPEAPSRGGNCWRHVEDYCCFFVNFAPQSGVDRHSFGAFHQQKDTTF